METVIYLLIVCFIIFIIFSLLPIILPVIIIIIIAVSIYLWYIRRKFMKKMNTYDEQSTYQDTSYQSYENRNMKDDIIDVEYTETQEETIDR